MAGYTMAQTQPEPQGWLAYKWKVLISVVFGIFMIILDSTVVNVALRTIQSQYNVSLSQTQWAISIYVLALGIMTPLSGFLADRIGIKRIYIAGLSLFVIGSFLCGIAASTSHSIWWLVAMRALQGAGGGMAQPLASAFIFSTFPAEEQGTALGFFGIGLVVAPALGPILGGLLVDRNLWEWIFFINVPIGILGITLASLWLRERPSQRKHKADPLGVIVAIISFGAILLAASQVSESGWDSTIVLVSFAIGAAGLILFAIAELFLTDEPLLDLRLYQRPTFLISSMIGYVAVIGLFGAEFLMPLYLQVLRGRTALETGFILLPMAITSAFTTPIAGRFYDKIGPRVLVIIGYSILMINTWQLALLEANTPISWLLFLLALRGIALGMTVQTTFTTALGAVPRQNLARGSSLINGTRFVVQSVGVAVLATVLTGSLSTQTKDLQERSQEFTSSAQSSTAVASTTQAHFGLCETIDPKTGKPFPENLPPAFLASPAAQQPAVKAQLSKAIDQGCHEYVSGFEQTYKLTFYFAALACVLGIFMPGWPGKWAGRAAQQTASGGGH